MSAKTIPIPEPDENPKNPSLTPEADQDPDQIRVGQLGQLIVPAEDIGIDDGGRDIDFSASMTALVRKSARHEWFGLKPGFSLTTRLLPIRSGPNGIEITYYYVADGPARSAIRDELHDIKAVPYFSFRDRCWNIWVIRVTDSLWFRSLEPLFEQPAEFYAGNAFRAASNKAEGRYNIKTKPAPWPVPEAPAKSVSEILGEALGPLRFITSVDHPVIRELTQGVEI